MGVTSLVIDIANPAKPAVTARLEFVVDSAAVSSVVPAPVLRKLGIRPLGRETFHLADGRSIVRRKGVARSRVKPLDWSSIHRGASSARCD